MTEDDEAWLAAAFERLRATHDVQLRDEIAQRTEWLALRGARRFATRGEQFDDLLQVARIGLIKAIDRFDPARGVQFGAYATPTIMGELRRHFRDHTWSVHVPRRAKDLRPAVTATIDALSKELGRTPSVADVAARLDSSEEAVIEALEAGRAYRPASLDPTDDRDAATAAAGAGLDEVVDREVVLELLARLDRRERTILYLRFYEELSQAQISKRVGMSQVHVGRLLAVSLRSMREALEREESADGA